MCWSAGSANIFSSGAIPNLLIGGEWSSFFPKPRGSTKKANTQKRPMHTERHKFSRETEKKMNDGKVSAIHVTHQFELPEGAIRPRWKYNSINVFGCGVVLDSEDKLAIFFTLNGQLIGRKIPITPRVDRLFPAVTMMWNDYFEANFGDDPANPFEYNIQKCPGLELACI